MDGVMSGGRDDLYADNVVCKNLRMRQQHSFNSSLLHVI